MQVQIFCSHPPLHGKECQCPTSAVIQQCANRERLMFVLVEKMLKSQRKSMEIISEAAFWMALFSARPSSTGQPSRLEESVCGSHRNARQSWVRWFSSLNDYRLLPHELTRFRESLKVMVWGEEWRAKVAPRCWVYKSWWLSCPLWLKCAKCAERG